MLLSAYLTSGLAVSTGALLGWGVKPIQQVRKQLRIIGRSDAFILLIVTNILQNTGRAVPWDYRRFNRFITLARTRKHVHPNFIADVETLLLRHDCNLRGGR